MVFQTCLDGVRSVRGLERCQIWCTVLGEKHHFLAVTGAVPAAGRLLFRFGNFPLTVATSLSVFKVLGRPIRALFGIIHLVRGIKRPRNLF